ncbi:hypothetical protein [Acetobacter sp.]|uniref:hypothetical protein n=1 Tax=Acetobacter sp. TaxID=440 RepID=UPI0039EC5D3B
MPTPLVFLLPIGSLFVERGDLSTKRLNLTRSLSFGLHKSLFRTTISNIESKGVSNRQKNDHLFHDR